MANVNTIELAQKFLPLMDEVYKMASVTSMFDLQNVEFVNANTVKYYDLSMSGLGNYDRNAGFPKGAVKGEWKTWELTQDRGTTFSVDAMDDEETLRMTFGPLTSRFIREHVAPEIDAYTFAKFASTPNILTATGDIQRGTTKITELIDEAEYQMNDAEVPTEGRILFISNEAYAALKPNISRGLSNETTVQTNIEMYDDMRVIKVPQGRFNTAITLKDVTDGTDGGFEPTDGGYKINFMIVHPSAVRKCMKHVKPRIFSPDVNQTADAWKFDYRVYHDVFAFERKANGIYMHRAATAN